MRRFASARYSGDEAAHQLAPRVLFGVPAAARTGTSQQGRALIQVLAITMTAAALVSGFRQPALGDLRP